MTMCLILTRHAKSDWGDPMLDDHDRPLNARGLHDAPRIGAWLQAKGIVPESVTVSSARRARETWHGIASSLDASPETRTAAQLYHASPDVLLAHARAGHGRAQMLIGHNPGMAEAAHRLAGQAADHPRFADFPTLATLVLAFYGDDWRALDWGTGRVLGFVTPHDLP